ncbi:conserved hypothetical protein [Ricinus communis]|uniref:Uncharacterized protein n=1 Tax=Ricinus communis TaxID=3988 RepID=B9RSL4_RICCO|nr:conserved hypothetical protein [Ricinus communis]
MIYDVSLVEDKIAHLDMDLEDVMKFQEALETHCRMDREQSYYKIEDLVNQSLVVIDETRLKVVMEIKSCFPDTDLSFLEEANMEESEAAMEIDPASDALLLTLILMYLLLPSGACLILLFC